MHRVIVVGSPRPDGRSACLADELFNACIEECPEDGVSIVSVASIEVGPCRGCDACRASTEVPDKLPEDDDNLAICSQVAASDALVHRCVVHDDMTEVRKHLDAADELIVVSPVYFASAPAQLKCLLDRLQPYFWSNLRDQPKRPCVLHVVGEGGDPHGFEPLIGCVRSAFSCAGFELELVLDWVGKIDASGEIVAEAEEYPLPPLGGFAGLEWEEVDEADVDVRAGACEPSAEECALEPASTFGAVAEDGPADEFAAALSSATSAASASSAAEPAAAPSRGAAGKRAKLSLAEADAGATGAGGSRGERKRAQGGANASASTSRGGKGSRGGQSGQRKAHGQKGKASYGKNAQGKGKRRG